MKTRRGFTLVEVLVVMAIVSLLVALLLPALSAAKREAQISACLSNHRSVGIALASYAADYKDAVPSNVHNPTGSDAGGPYKYVNNTGDTASGKFVAWNNSGRAMRFDKSASAPNYGTTNFTWLGLGLLWVTEYVPFTINGGKAFWDPGESIGVYSGNIPQWGYGPGFYFSSMKAKPWQSAGDIATLAYSGYSYRSVYGIPTSVTRGEWPRISSLPRYVAMVDCAENLFGEGAAASGNTRRVSPHDDSAGNYRGINRLWYDGRALFMNDMQASAWRNTCPSGNTNYGNWYSTIAWSRYDVP